MSKNCKILKGACLNETYLECPINLDTENKENVYCSFGNSFPKIPDILLQTFIHQIVTKRYVSLVIWLK